MNEIMVITDNDQLVVSSREVSENFGKDHKSVLRSIESITAQNCALTQMFHKTTYASGTGKAYPMYLMNRDGFSLLAMGFTGKAALEWKLKYIAAFNAMEQQLSQKQPNLTELSPELRCPIRLEQQQKQQAQELVRLNQKLDQLQGTRAFGTGGWRRADDSPWHGGQPSDWQRPRQQHKYLFYKEHLTRKEIPQ